MAAYIQRQAHMACVRIIVTKPQTIMCHIALLPPLNHILLITHKFSSVTGSVSLVASVAEGDNVCMVVLPDC